MIKQIKKFCSSAGVFLHSFWIKFVIFIHDSGRVLWYHVGCLCVRLPICPSVRTYARYIGRLAFVLMLGLFLHCGVKNCVVGLKNR